MTPHSGARRRSRGPGWLAAAAAGVAILLAALPAGDLVRPAIAARALTPGSFTSPPIAIGGYHTCVLPGDGTVLCWGDDTFGQIGDGRVTDPGAPAGDVLVQQMVIADLASASSRDCSDVVADGSVIRCHGAASLAGVTAIAAGYSHTCALLGDSTVKCWGSNAAIDGGQLSPSLSGGELGDGTTIVRPAPVTVIAGPGQTAPLSGVRALSAAAGYTCALLLDTTARCWGNAPGATSTAPIPLMADATHPLSQIAEISAGDRNACARLVDGSVVCWGEGLLGDQQSDTPRDGHLPVKVTVAGSPTTSLGGIIGLALGHNVFNGPNGFGMGHSCALETTGEVVCWGINDVSQLGNGSNGLTEVDSGRDYAVPVIAAPGSSERLTGVTAIAAGGYFTCALLGDGSVRCWGLGLGGDSFEGGGAPVPLAIDPNSIAASHGGIVLAHVTDRPVLTAAATPLAGVVAVAAGGSGVCVTLADGSVSCSTAGAFDVAAVPGVSIAAPAGSPGPTPAPTGPTTDLDRLVGDWDVTYGSPSVVTFAFANGTYTVTAKSPIQVVGSACFLPAGTVIATFTGSGRTYSGQHGLWSTSNCQFARWTAMMATLDAGGRTITANIAEVGGATVFTRRTPGSTPAPGGGATAPEGVVGDWQNGRLTIAYKDGLYSVTQNTAFTVAAGQGASSETCHVAAGTVTWTFSGSGGRYVGQQMAWRSPGCQIIWLTTNLTWSGDSLTVETPFNGTVGVWHRAAAGPGAFRNSLPLPWEVHLTPEVVVATLAFVGGVVILLPFPSALFNSTLQSNYAEILRRARRARRRLRNLALGPWFAIRARLGLRAGPGRLPLDSEAAVSPGEGGPVSPPVEGQERDDLWRTPLGVGLFILATAVLSGFLDPGFGINTASLTTLAGMLIGLVAVLAAFELPAIVFYRRHAIGFWFRALPATIAVSVVCVLISRLTDFQPGYLYGLIITTAFATKLSGPVEARLTAIGVTSALAAAMLAWFGLGAISPWTSASLDPGPVLVIMQTVLTMIVAAGIETAAFGLLPLAFLSGPSVFRWNRFVWLILITFGWCALGIIILNPQNGYLSDSTRTPLLTIVGLLAFFSIGSIAFWAYFRRYRRMLERAKGVEA